MAGSPTGSYLTSTSLHVVSALTPLGAHRCDPVSLSQSASNSPDLTAMSSSILLQKRSGPYCVAGHLALSRRSEGSMDLFLPGTCAATLWRAGAVRCRQTALEEWPLLTRSSLLVFVVVVPLPRDKHYPTTASQLPDRSIGHPGIRQQKGLVGLCLALVLLSRRASVR
jgi:hypothetical protein